MITLYKMYVKSLIKYNNKNVSVIQCGRQVVGDIKKCFCGAEIGGKSYDVAKEGNIKIEK